MGRESAVTRFSTPPSPIERIAFVKRPEHTLAPTISPLARKLAVVLLTRCPWRWCAGPDEPMIRPWAPAVLCLALLGCSGESPPGPADARSDGVMAQDEGGVDAAADVGADSTPLVEASLWEPLGQGADPFGDRPAIDPVCPSGGVKVEDGGTGDPLLEVDTGICEYVTLAQPSLARVRAGEEVEVVLWHLDLFAAEPAEAHVVIRLGEHTVWEERISVPARANFFSPRWMAPTEVPQGTPVLFHLHNHGVNNWKLLRIRRVALAPH